MIFTARQNYPSSSEANNQRINLGMSLLALSLPLIGQEQHPFWDLLQTIKSNTGSEVQSHIRATTLKWAKSCDENAALELLNACFERVAHLGNRFKDTNAHERWEAFCLTLALAEMHNPKRGIQTRASDEVTRRFFDMSFSLLREEEYGYVLLRAPLVELCANLGPNRIEFKRLIPFADSTLNLFIARFAALRESNVASSKDEPIYISQMHPENLAIGKAVVAYAQLLSSVKDSKIGDEPELRKFVGTIKTELGNIAQLKGTGTVGAQGVPYLNILYISLATAARGLSKAERLAVAEFLVSAAEVDYSAMPVISQREQRFWARRSLESVGLEYVTPDQIIRWQTLLEQEVADLSVSYTTGRLNLEFTGSAWVKAWLDSRQDQPLPQRFHELLGASIERLIFAMEAGSVRATPFEILRDELRARNK